MMRAGKSAMEGVSPTIVRALSTCAAHADIQYWPAISAGTEKEERSSWTFFRENSCPQCIFSGSEGLCSRCSANVVLASVPGILGLRGLRNNQRWIFAALGIDLRQEGNGGHGPKVALGVGYGMLLFAIYRFVFGMPHTTAFRLNACVTLPLVVAVSFMATRLAGMYRYVAVRFEEREKALIDPADESALEALLALSERDRTHATPLFLFLFFPGAVCLGTILLLSSSLKSEAVQRYYVCYLAIALFFCLQGISFVQRYVKNNLILFLTSFWGGFFDELSGNALAVKELFAWQHQRVRRVVVVLPFLYAVAFYLMYISI